MKKISIAIILNLFLPGTGFVYLGGKPLIFAGILYFLSFIYLLSIAIVQSKYCWIVIGFLEGAVIFITQELTRYVNLIRHQKEKAESRNLYCSKCDKKNPLDSIFCQYCGNRIKP